MRVKLALLAVALIVVLISLPVLFFPSSPKSDGLYQILPYNTFAAGAFDGNTTFSELAAHGDFGIGTLNGLNGEMFALDGKFYQIPVDGAPREIAALEKTPYATVTFFDVEQSFQVTGVPSYSQLTSIINSSLPDYDLIYAIRIHGSFDLAKTRSVPIQSQPYPTVFEAVANQTVFNLEKVDGTLVGFFFPESMSGVDFAGYHLHFLTDDHSAGGHLLDCVVADAVVEIDVINSYNLILS